MMSFLPNKSINISSMIIVVRAAFHEKNKHYPQVIFMNVCINYRHERNKKFLCFTYLFINYHCINDS